MKKTLYKILLVDDHQLILDGIVKIISEIDNIDAIYTANSYYEALEILKKQKVDLLISDLEMPEIGGIELLQKVKKEFRGIKTALLTMYNYSELAREIIAIDADAYILKSANADEMCYAISEILKGKKYFSQNVTIALANTEIREQKKYKELSTLTQREREIIGLIAKGLSNKKISEKLFVSIKTVDSHRSNLMSKLNIHNIAGLTRYAIENKLL